MSLYASYDSSLLIINGEYDFDFVMNMLTKIKIIMEDSGADISLFKRASVDPEHIVNVSNTSKIKGVTSELVHSLGTTETNILINGYQINQTFHIVSENFPIPCDGVLGRDVLIKYKVHLNYFDWTMSTWLNNNTTLILPVHSSLEDNIICIPSKSEVVRKVNCLKDLSSDAVVVNKELSPGVFVTRTIVSKDNLIKINKNH